MPIDQQDGGLDDWFVPARPTSGADGPDDWFVPASDGYPDDWFVPASAAAQPALGPPPSIAKPALTTRPAPPPDPLTALWSLIPASKWVTPPPIFPDAFGRFPLPPAAPPTAPRLDAGYGLLGALANLPATNAPRSGLLDALANLPSADPAAFPSLQWTGPAYGDGDRSTTLSLLQSLSNLPWSPQQPTTSGGVGNAGDTYAVTGDEIDQSSSPNNAPLGDSPFNALSGPNPSPLNSQTTDPAVPSFVQRIGLTTGDRERPQTSTPLQNLPSLDELARSNEQDDAEHSSEISPSIASPTNSNESRSITRVVRDPTGRALAVIHVQPAPSEASPSDSDATPDSLRSGAKYAQVNNAVTGKPVIDRTTDMLLAALQESVLAMGPGLGATFGTAVHVDFANRIRKLDLPGIGQDGVEQGFHLDIKDFIRYGLRRSIRYGLPGSIRTDVILRDPKDPNQRPIAVYDLKTGNAVLTPSRVKEILDKVGTPGLLVIELQYRTGDALDRTTSSPRQ